jgi:hypothetical protein
METGIFSYFTDESLAVPKGRATVLYAVPNHSGREVAPQRTDACKDGTQELSFRTDEGRFFDLVIETAYTRGTSGEVVGGRDLSEIQICGPEARDAWIGALPQPPSFSMQGWVIERYDAVGGILSGKRRRYALFDMSTSLFSLYLTKESALLDDKAPEFRAVVKYADRLALRWPFDVAL